MQDKGSRFIWKSTDGQVSDEMPNHLLYTEADALEEKILFPEDSTGDSRMKRFRGIENDLTRFESGQLQEDALQKFVHDVDTDEEELAERDRQYLEGETDDGDSGSWEDATSDDDAMDLEDGSTSPGGQSYGAYSEDQNDGVKAEGYVSALSL